jgi:hypothetical protein
MTDNKSRPEIQAFGHVKEVWESLPTKSCWIAGGCMRSWLVGDRVKDVDIFSEDPEETLRAFKANDNYTAGRENDFIAHFYRDKLRYEIIKKYAFSNQQETIDNFDFTIIAACFGPDGLVVDERFYIDNAQRRLVVKQLLKPLSTMRRALKFTGRGYRICPKGLARIMRAIQENPIDWDNPKANDIEFYPDGTPAFRGLD